MYDAVDDPACYPGSGVLKNIPDIRSQAVLSRFEAVATARRFMEPMPVGRWTVSHYRAVHRHIFQDVYHWAGRFRNVRTSKGGSMFCYPEHIPNELQRIFGQLKLATYLRDLDRRAFAAGAAHFLAELNAVHAFRDGNGRSQFAFIVLLSEQAGHWLDLDRLEPAAFLTAMIASFHGDEVALEQEFLILLDHD